jgi:hypothetical protein
MKRRSFLKMPVAGAGAVALTIAAAQGAEADEDEELRELKRKFAQMLMEEARRYYGSDF